MAKRLFRELVTPFLREKLDALSLQSGVRSPEYQALARQYLRTEHEDEPAAEKNLRHYDADVSIKGEGHAIPGIERLYGRTLVIEPTLACAAHCRYCIRANYPRHNLSEDQLLEVAKFCGAAENTDNLREILITGGDVLLVPQRVNFLLDAVARYAPNIRTARIATRIPVQEPSRINAEVLSIFRRRPGLRLELATQINHAVELFPETVEALEKIMATGTRIYAQNVLLRGVNDNVATLIELYDALRDLGIESHYLFHCVPLAGMQHLRTTIDEALVLARDFANGGHISGRAKPMLAAMTDIGKIVLYEGTVLRRRDRRVLLQSGYKLTDRLKWNPNWRMPDNAELDENGQLRLWYLDGMESGEGEMPEVGSYLDGIQRARGLRLPVLA